MKQLQNLNTQTAKDAQHYIDIMYQTMHNNKLDNTNYQEIYFETGCALVEHIYGLESGYANCILTNGHLNFWNWFLVKYVDHDERHCSKIKNIEMYKKSKAIWINTSNIKDSLLNFYQKQKLH